MAWLPLDFSLCSGLLPQSSKVPQLPLFTRSALPPGMSPPLLMHPPDPKSSFDSPDGRYLQGTPPFPVATHHPEPLLAPTHTYVFFSSAVHSAPSHLMPWLLEDHIELPGFLCYPLPTGAWLRTPCTGRSAPEGSQQTTTGTAAGYTRRAHLSTHPIRPSGLIVMPLRFLEGWGVKLEHTCSVWSSLAWGSSPLTVNATFPSRRSHQVLRPAAAHMGRIFRHYFNPREQLFLKLNGAGCYSLLHLKVTNNSRQK